LFKKHNIYITKHALKRTDERFGEYFWAGEKIKETTRNNKEQFILNQFQNVKDVEILDYQNFKVINDNFNAICVLNNEKKITLKTIINTGELTYFIGEVIEPQQKRQLMSLSTKKAIGPEREPTAS